ncbi:Ig-like domain-containing protein [Bacterioplanoides sp.]|uniref:Ig-like domain-containing protein n=1 Tax=Bacterioplanoides sp. TaxID=2066072 RepID=UPI003B5B04F8
MTFLIRIKLVTLMSLLLIACGGSGSSGGNDSSGGSGGNGGDGGSGNTLLDPKLALSNQVVLTDGKLQLKVGDELALPVTTDSDATVSYSSSDESVVKIGEGGGALTVGSATITIRVAATAKYNAASLSVDVVVSKRPQPLTLQDGVSKVFDLTNNNLSMRVFGNRGNDSFTVTSSDESVIRIVQQSSQSFNFMTAGAGSATVSVVAAGSDTYEQGQIDIVLKVRAEQQVSFAESSAVTLVKNSTISRPLQVQGIGQVSYASSNSEVAQVTNNGSVVGVRFGSATITASVAADDNYSAAQSSYTVNVVDGSMEVIAEVGQSGSRLSIKSSQYPLNWTVSDLSCIGICVNPQNGTLTADGNVDQTVTTLANPSRLRLSTSLLETADLTLGFGPRPQIRGAAHIEFGGYWWIFGGQPANSNLATNGIWRSKDGILWEGLRTASPFTARRLHDVAEHNGELWIAGGLYRENTLTQEAFVDTVWKSSDGINWTQVAANLPVTDRSYRMHRTLITSYNNKLQVFAGGLSIYNISGLYSTTDGTDWDKVTGFSSRNSLYGDSQLSKLTGRLVITNPTGDVYYSTDAQSWTAARVSTIDANQIGGHKALAFDGRVWVIGSKNSIYSSADGNSWEKETDTAGYSTRQSFDFAMAFKNRFWIGGGRSRDLINVPKHKIVDTSLDTWVSNDLTNWTREESEGEFPGLQSHEMVSFNNRLWIIGGASNENNAASNEVWVSDDGIHWQPNRPADDSKLLPQSLGKASVAELNGALWMYFVSYTDKKSYIAKGELVNGTLEWSRHEVADIPARRDQQLVSFKDQLWVIGGRQYESPFAGLEDVWSSSDGTSWTQATADFGFGEAIYHLRAVANSERLVVTGSTNSGSRGNLQIRYTSDGSQWFTVSTKDANNNGNIELESGYDITLDGSALAILTSNSGASYFTSISGLNPMQTATKVTLEHPPRSGMAVHHFNNRIWLTGGDDRFDHSYSSKSIWVSDDGENWKRVGKRRALLRIAE